MSREHKLDDDGNVKLEGESFIVRTEEKVSGNRKETVTDNIKQNLNNVVGPNRRVEVERIGPYQMRVKGFESKNDAVNAITSLETGDGNNVRRNEFEISEATQQPDESREETQDLVERSEEIIEETEEKVKQTGEHWVQGVVESLEETNEELREENQFLEKERETTWRKKLMG